MCLTTKTAEEWHARFSNGQVRPFVGPFIFSPLKALLGTIQIITGLAIAILFGVLTILTCTISKSTMEVTRHALHHVGMGFTALFSSILNIATLGLTAYTFKKLTYVQFGVDWDPDFAQRKAKQQRQ